MTGFKRKDKVRWPIGHNEREPDTTTGTRAQVFEPEYGCLEFQVESSTNISLQISGGCKTEARSVTIDGFEEIDFRI